MDKLKNNINVAMGRRKADLVLKNASIINVYTQMIDKLDIAIEKDTIVGLGEYEGITEMDCEGLYVAPGFIDGHVHVESSMVTPEILSHILIKKGVTTIVADPHEIANVLGSEGIKLMLENGQSGAIDSFFMLPSCVPAVHFEHNGAILKAKQLSKFMNHPKVLGLGEVMDVGAVVSGNEEMLKKISLSNNYQKRVDGHCPNVGSHELNAYLASGIMTDHECTRKDEALEKVSRGMYVLLREGSQAKDLIHLLPAINQNNYHRFLFCTDDRHIEDIMEEGSIDHIIRLAIENGLDPIKAYTMASFNAANCYHLDDRGAISPGKKADLVIFEDLNQLNIKHVIKNGQIYKENEFKIAHHFKKINSIRLKPITQDVFNILGNGKKANVIKVHPGSLVTSKVKRKVEVKNGSIENIIEEDGEINKIAVFERHKYTGLHFTGWVEGIGLKNAAIAQSISHDSHNIIVLGDNDVDMTSAVNHLIQMGGGIVFVSENKILESLSLPIGGIISDEDPNQVLKKVKSLNALAKNHGIIDGVDPYVALSFMALPVIPELKMTSEGLFQYSCFKIIDLVED